MYSGIAIGFWFLGFGILTAGRDCNVLRYGDWILVFRVWDSNGRERLQCTPVSRLGSPSSRHSESSRLRGTGFGC